MTQNPISRSACAKIILCGEHAVVYERPAIALPLPHLRARADVTQAGGRTEVVAPDIQAQFFVDEQPEHPLAQVIAFTLHHIRRGLASALFRLTVRSDIPVSSHLGSGAAVSVAAIRAVAAYLDCALSADETSAIAYEIEKLHHGTPSGIDNTVIAYEQPVWFVKGRGVEVLVQGDDGRWTMDESISPVASLPLVIADTGIATPTKIPVGDVRAGWERDKATYEARFDEIGDLVAQARQALLSEDWPALGTIMNANHAVLQWLGVSCAELDHLCDVARVAGALGAKMSGGGRGGNMIALARDAVHANELRAALRAAGAVRVF